LSGTDLRFYEWSADSPDLPREVANLPLPNPSNGNGNGNGNAHGKIIPIAELEKLTILSAITELNGDKLQAARRLDIGKTTLYRKLKEYAAHEFQPGARNSKFSWEW
jgi:transcriptional regulator of acetoin/glycerol metabolism